MIRLYILLEGFQNTVICQKAVSKGLCKESSELLLPNCPLNVRHSSLVTEINAMRTNKRLVKTAPKLT